MKEGKKLCKFFFGSSFYRKLLVVVEWINGSVVLSFSLSFFIILFL